MSYEPGILGPGVVTGHKSPSGVNIVSMQLPALTDRDLPTSDIVQCCYHCYGYTAPGVAGGKLSSEFLRPRSVTLGLFVTHGHCSMGRIDCHLLQCMLHVIMIHYSAQCLL